jgi:transposase
VARGQAPKTAKHIPRDDITEKAFRKGQNYMTLPYERDRSTVEAISDGNGTAIGNACFSQLSDAVDKDARAEHKALKSHRDDTLTGTRIVWLTAFERLPEHQHDRFAAVMDSGLETGKAWAYEEMLREHWARPDEATALTYILVLYKRVIDTRLKPFKQVTRTIKRRLANVVSYCSHGITNAVAEGINSKTIAIARRVGGDRKRKNFKTAIHFQCADSNSTHNKPGWTACSLKSVASSFMQK